MQVRIFLAGVATAVLCAGAMTNRVVVTEGSALATLNVRPEVNGEVEVRWAGQSERIALPEGTREVALKRTGRGLFVYAGNEPLWQRWGAATGEVVVAHGQAMLPTEGRDEYVQKLAPFAFADSFMVAEGEALPPHWEVIRGEWGLSNVTNSFEGGGRRQRNERQPLAAKSPNFYSAQGLGRNALVVTGESFHEHYALRASVQHNGGRNGIAFMVTDDGKFLSLTARTDPATGQVVVELSAHKGETSRVLDAVWTELRPGQWMLMEVRVTDDEVRGFVDNVEVLRVRCALPPGGRYGLYADVEGEPTRFDDVECVSHEDYSLNTAEDMARMTVGEDWPFIAVGPENAVCWEKPASGMRGHEAERFFGTEDDGPHLLSVRFLVRADEQHLAELRKGHPELGLKTPAMEPYTIGLQAQGYRFCVSRLEDGQHMAMLSRGRTLDDTNTLFIAQTTVTAQSLGKFVTLTLDTSRQGEVRCLVDGKLVLLHLTKEEPRGMAGIMAVGYQSILHNTPTYTTLAPVWADRVEKNTQYSTDPFMRHWASAEGQWHINRKNETWLRGDTLGKIRIQLPVTPSATLYMGLDETSLTNADVRVELRDGMLSAHVPSGATNAVWSVSLKDLPVTAFENPKGNRSLYTVGLEDHVLWAGSEQGMLAVATLPDLPRGRKVRLEGVPLEELRFSRVRRENVFDSLFNESLYAWTLNGGQWEVVARFQCDPTWSHLNGENKTGLAALWSKYEFTGDFSIEFFAGMRMGWYERGGDLNITVMNAADAPVSGYTVTTTGWDPDHSQTLTRLFRDGVCVTNTTAYAVPRHREGQARKAGYEPLIAGGRDMHGAWYGMRLRRIGGKLTYLFDNEPLLAWHDARPLAAGGFGIWTFQNSMMVARARIVAENMKPRAFKFGRLTPVDKPVVPVEAPESLRIGGLPANLLAPALWEPADAISQPHTTYFQNGFRTTSTAAGGTFLTHAKIPPFPAASVLGFEFDFALATNTLVNFEFSSGTLKDGALDNATLWSFALTGTQDKRGTRLILPPPDTPLAVSADPAKPVWNRVTLWLPSALISSKETHLQLDGFGNLQTSDIQQGLIGNLPGAWYAVRNLRPVWNSAPSIVAPGHSELIEKFDAQITALPPGRIHLLELPKELSTAPLPPLAFAIPKVGEFELIAAPDSEIPGFLRIRSAEVWNSPLLPPKNVLIDNQPAPFTMQQNDALILLPPTNTAAAVRLDLTTADGRTWRTSVPACAAPKATPPRLVSLATSAGKYIAFDNRLDSPIPLLGNASVSVTPGVPGHGSVLTIANKGAFRRLDALLDPAYDPVATPLIQFSYAGTPSSTVTLTYANHHFRFTENTGNSSTLTPNPITPDPDRWHTFLTLPLANLPGLRLNADAQALPPAPLRIASRNNPDQTGLYSTLQIDALAFGPALNPGAFLHLTPLYASPSKKLTLFCALLPGNLPYPALSNEQRDALHWLAISPANAAPDAVDFDAISLAFKENLLILSGSFFARDISLSGLRPLLASMTHELAITSGVHHILLRAIDEFGNTSAVTDFPFLYAASAAALSFLPPEITPNNNNLSIRLASPVSPPNLRNATLTCDTTELKLTQSANAVTYAVPESSIELNWPLTLRREIQKSADGDTLRLTLSNVTDLAGNLAAPLSIPIPINYAADTTPPTLISIQRPSHIAAWIPAFNSMNDLFDFFPENQIDHNELITETNGLRSVRLGLPSKNHNLLLRRNFTNRNNTPLNLGEHSRLALALRLNTTNTTPVLKLLLALRNPPAGAPQPKENNLHVFDLPADLKPGEWTDLVVDLPGLFPDLTPADLNLESLGLRLSSTSNNTAPADTLSIRAVALFGTPGTEKSDIHVDTYDASGIRGLRFLDTAPDTPPSPTRIKPDAFPQKSPDAPPSIFRPFQILDRAGNTTTPYIIPEAQ